MKTYRVCNVCNEEISVESVNWYQELARNKVLNLKCHIHYKSHGIKFLTMKGLIKSILIFIIVWIFAIVTFPIWLITYPFWWIHEQIN
jgi:hypothetical protein